ncbi:hypothetical protein IV203_033115 [Nitzschia inconspicua]|uniref:Uncharacterized protein n=1 Tax=Nitzschia inconspicua TaxID=303405 RepID=A0A9K3PHX6_9STRA|nr:hypothetical protein IV203_033115 [Nitzschia inconspicua]
MNHANFSPGQPNEAAGRKVTPSSRNSDSGERNSSSVGDDIATNCTKKQSVSSRFLIGEDLQKIRHSSHRNRAQMETEESDRDDEDDNMDDSDHDNVIKDLLYPALEEGSSRSRNMDFAFFEDDYQAALAAMNTTGSTTTTAASTAQSSFRSSMTSINDSFRNSSMRSSMAVIPEPGQLSPNDASSISASNSAYLNVLRWRRSNNDPFDASVGKHNR